MQECRPRRTCGIDFGEEFAESAANQNRVKGSRVHLPPSLVATTPVVRWKSNSASCNCESIVGQDLRIKRRYIM